MLRQINLLSNDVSKIKEKGIEFEKNVEGRNKEGMQKIDSVRESFECKLDTISASQHSSQDKIADIEGLLRQNSKEIKDICSGIEEQTRIVQNLTQYCYALSDEIKSVINKNEMISTLILQKNDEDRNSFGTIGTKLDNVAADERITQQSLEEIGKVLIQNNDKTIKAMIEMSEMTDKILHDYKSNLNAVISAIMAANLTDILPSCNKEN